LDWQEPPPDLSDVFTLLSWRTRIVPLIGRDHERHQLAQWATSNTSGPPKIRFLTSEGGSGKSRLAAELAQTLQVRGLEAGFLKLDRTVVIPQKPTLFIVDYPEERRAFTRTLLEELAAHPKWPVRLLLLSRRSLDEWHDDVNSANALHLVDQQAFALAPLDRNAGAPLFAAVIDELVKRYGIQEPRLRPDAFEHWSDQNPYLHRQPLFIVAAALHAAIDPAHALELSAERIVDALVRRERGRLQRVSRDLGFQEDAAARLAAIAALRGGFNATMLRQFAEPHLEIGISAPNRVVDDMRHVPWWQDNAWSPPSPDILAAALVYTVFAKRPDLAPGWLWAAISDLTPETLIERLSRVVHDVGIVYGSRQGQLRDWLVRMIATDTARANSLEFFAYRQLPVSLAPLGVAVCRALLQNDTLGESQRANLMISLSVQLSDSGDRPAALNAIEEAVEVYRRLAKAQPAAFEPALALSLNTLSNRLSNSGDRPAALTAIEEAVEIRRRLAKAQPAAFEPDLAGSLNTLSVQLSNSGDRPAALTAIEEAVEIRRRLAKAQPAAFEPALARSLALQKWIGDQQGE
jgi:hypothetical protein